jgi:hypothetical protein
MRTIGTGGQRTTWRPEGEESIGIGSLEVARDHLGYQGIARDHLGQQGITWDSKL